MPIPKGGATINKKWIDNQANYHIGMPASTGKVPDKTLGFTDGCGNEMRFPLGVAIWAGNDFIELPVPKKNDKHLIWKELVPILDFGGDIYFHDVNSNFDIKTEQGIKVGFNFDQEQAVKKINRRMKTLVVPNGNKDYYKAALTYDPIVIISDQGGQQAIYPQNPPLTLHKKYMSRHNFDNEGQEYAYYQKIANEHDSSNPQWFQFFAHGVGQAMMNVLRKINDLYGKDGKDDIWFATIDEVYEYYHFKENYPILKKEEGNRITFSIDAHPDVKLPEEHTYHRDFTLLIKGIEKMDEVQIKVGSNVYGYAYTFDEKTQTLMVNMNCNKSLLNKAERYTDYYIQSPSEETKADALYFVKQLTPERQKPLLQRLNMH